MLVSFSSSSYIPLRLRRRVTVIKTFEAGSAVTSTKNDVVLHKDIESGNAPCGVAKL